MRQTVEFFNWQEWRDFLRHGAYSPTHSGCGFCDQTNGDLVRERTSQFGRQRIAIPKAERRKGSGKWTTARHLLAPGHKPKTPSLTCSVCDVSVWLPIVAEGLCWLNSKSYGWMFSTDTGWICPDCDRGVKDAE